MPGTQISIGGYFLRGAGATVILTALLLFVLAWKIAGEQGCEVSEESLLRPFKICSPFGSRTLISLTEYSAALRLPLFPDATGVEQRMSSRDTNTLAFLELTSGSPVAVVERWYENALGPTYRKSEGTCASFDLPGQEWMQRVLEDCIGSGAMFLAQDQAKASGVLVSSADGEKCVLRLFHYEKK